MELLILAISAALVVSVILLVVVWAPGNGQHRTNDGSSSASSRVRPAPACTGTALTPASNVQVAINRAPPGTTFCFGPGIYRVSSLIPNSGDVLDGGDRTAILVGSPSALRDLWRFDLAWSVGCHCPGVCHPGLQYAAAGRSNPGL